MTTFKVGNRKPGRAMRVPVPERAVCRAAARLSRAGCAAGVALALCAGAAAAGEGRFAVSGFGGVLLDNDFQEVLQPWRLEIEGSQLAGIAGEARLARPLEGLDIGVEAQIVRHVHGQTHWELNAPVLTARWMRFPWDAHLDTSAAFGLGLSVTSETPRREIRNEGASQPMMAYWMVELSVALPPEDWELIARLHHRSTAYGTFGDKGGANALVMGLRHRF